MENTNATKVITGELTLSYPHLFEAYANQPGQTPKFSATLLIPKSDTTTRAKIDAAIQAAVQQGLSKNWNGVKPPIIAVPIHDGDGVRPSDGSPFPAECKGHWVMTASSKNQPQVVDAALNPIMSQSEIYAGVKARVSLNFYAYNFNGRKGIGCGLNNVQKIRDGEPLTSFSNAADDFTPIAPQPQAYAAPQQQQYQQPQYTQPQAYTAPQQQYAAPQQQYAAPQQQYAAPQPAAVEIDPITGQPKIPNMGY